jgi:hypothetical protein
MSKEGQDKNGRNPATNLALPLASKRHLGYWRRPARCSWLMLVGGAGVSTTLGKPCGTTPGRSRLTAPTRSDLPWTSRVFSWDDSYDVHEATLRGESPDQTRQTGSRNLPSVPPLVWEGHAGVMVGGAPSRKPIERSGLGIETQHSIRHCKRLVGD